MAAVTTAPIIWGEHGGVPGMANDNLPKPQPTTATRDPVNVDDPNAAQQSAAPFVGSPAEQSLTQQQNGGETVWSTVPTTIDEGPANTQQTKVELATPSQQTSFAPGAPGIPVAASSSSSGSNLSGGAVAGIAIAALIVGAALAFLAAFFFFKRRNTNNKTRDGTVGYNTYTDSTPELVMLQKSAGRNSPYVQVSQTPIPAPAPVQNPKSTDIAIATDILPRPSHDTEIQSRIAALFGQIHRHIDTYYRDVHASITPSMEPELVRFGAKDVNMAELLQDCSSPTTALKHALVAYILGLTSPKKSNGDEWETLFPKDINSAALHGGNGSNGSDAKLATAQTLHRRLSVYLYTASSNPHAASRRSWSAQSDIREAAEHFSLTFFPWANPVADDQEKEDDLTHVISEAMDTRIWLFGQPSEFVFRWDGVGTRGVVVSPELVKQDSNDGSGRGRVVLESGVAGL